MHKVEQIVANDMRQMSSVRGKQFEGETEDLRCDGAVGTNFVLV